MQDENYIFDLLHKGVEYGESLGADFCELRYDHLNLLTIENTNLAVKDTQTKERKGVGIVVYYHGAEGGCFTPELTPSGINQATKTAFQMAKSLSNVSQLKLSFPRKTGNKKTLKSTCQIHPKDVEFAEKIKYLNRVYNGIQETSEAQTSTLLYGELWGTKQFANSEGSEIEWHPLILDLIGLAITLENNSPSMGVFRKATSEGLEVFNDPLNSPEEIGRTAGKYSKELTQAKGIKSGKYRAVIGSMLGGVLAHESFGHLSEADSVVNGTSPISDQMDQRLGTPAVTIVDEGLPAYKGGLFLPFDDQGVSASRTVLLDQGILKNFLHNRSTAEKYHTNSTGNNRAVHYMYSPIPRMTNTYFEKGELSQEEALEALGTGIYAVDSNGGQVSKDGNFMFQCSRGYYVENGEIQYPIKDSALSGNILSFLKQIEAMTKDLKLSTGYFGGCGKKGQFPLPVGLGGPELVVKEVQIGGVN